MFNSDFFSALFDGGLDGVRVAVIDMSDPEQADIAQKLGVAPSLSEPINVDEIFARFERGDTALAPGSFAVAALTYHAGRSLAGFHPQVVEKMWELISKYNAGKRECSCGRPSCEAHATFVALARYDEQVAAGWEPTFSDQDEMEDFEPLIYGPDGPMTFDQLISELVDEIIGDEGPNVEYGQDGPPIDDEKVYQRFLNGQYKELPQPNADGAIDSRDDPELLPAISLAIYAGVQPEEFRLPDYVLDVAFQNLIEALMEEEPCCENNWCQVRATHVAVKRYNADHEEQDAAASAN